MAWRLRCEAAALANSPGGFAYQVAGDDVLISHRGRRATTLRGAAARRFLAEVEDEDPQEPWPG